MDEAPKNRRRRGSNRRKKTIAVTTRYDEGELAELDALASEAGLTRGGFQRVQSLRTAPRTKATRRAPEQNENLGRLLGQLGKIGSNLNQLGRAANSANYPENYPNAEDYKTALAELRGLIPASHEALAELRALVPIIRAAVGGKPCR